MEHPTWRAELESQFMEGPSSRAEVAARKIAALARGREEGFRLGSKAELRELCDVSVGTFNEALKILQSRGVLVMRPGPGGGLFVSTQSSVNRLANNVLDLEDARPPLGETVRIAKALDPLLVDEAATFGTEGQANILRARAADLEAAVRSGDAQATVAASLEVYAQMIRMVQSELLRTLLEVLLTFRIVVAKELNTAAVPAAQADLDEHLGDVRQLVEAICRRDAAGAALLLAQRDPVDFFAAIIERSRASRAADRRPA